MALSVARLKSFDRCVEEYGCEIGPTMIRSAFVIGDRFYCVVTYRFSKSKDLLMEELRLYKLCCVCVIISIMVCCVADHRFFESFRVASVVFVFAAKLQCSLLGNEIILCVSQLKIALCEFDHIA